MRPNTLTEFLYTKASFKKIPLSGTFELSPICNFSCRMCYVRKTRAEVLAHDRPMVTMEQWLEIACRAREEGMLFLLLTGGEPFLWPDFWPLYEELYGMGFLISINSNGSLIDDAAIARLRKMPPHRVNITLYGAGDDCYESLCGAKSVFAKVDRAICGLRAAGIRVKLNCSLTPQNVKDQEAIVQYAKENSLLLGMVEYMFPPLRRDPTMIGRNERFTPQEAAYYRLRRDRLMLSPEAYADYLKRTAEGILDPMGLDESCVDPVDGKVRCRAGNAAFWITWDGYMTPCGMMPEPKVDLLKHGFAESWQQITEQTGALKLSGTCISCGNQQLCHSCAAMAMAETGSVGGIPTYLCQLVAELKRLAIEELQTLNAENV